MGKARNLDESGYISRKLRQTAILPGKDQAKLADGSVSSLSTCIAISKLRWEITIMIYMQNHEHQSMFLLAHSQVCVKVGPVGAQ